MVGPTGSYQCYYHHMYDSMHEKGNKELDNEVNG